MKNFKISRKYWESLKPFEQDYVREQVATKDLNSIKAIINTARKQYPNFVKIYGKGFIELPNGNTLLWTGNDTKRFVLLDENKEKTSTSEPKKKMKKEYSEGKKEGREILNAYFTPLEICEQIWELAKIHGYDGGHVLEPACGTGNMLVHAPDQSKCVGFETSEKYFEIAKERFPKATFHNMYFEQMFLQPERFTDYYKGKERTWLKEYPFDLVIGNPPYGKFTGKYASYFSRTRKGNVPMKQYEFFFVYKALELLKKGGLVIYLTTQSFLSTGFNAYNVQKNAILKEADLIDSYRIGSVFEKTKVPVDILIFRKK